MVSLSQSSKDDAVPEKVRKTVSPASLLLRRFRRDHKGAAAVEFGIIAAPFFALLMGIFQVTVIYFAQSMMETGVAEAARMVRTGQVQTGTVFFVRMMSIRTMHGGSP